MEKLLEELKEKQATYNETLKEARSSAEAGEDVTDRFEKLDELREEIVKLEERKIHRDKLNQLDTIEEVEEKRFDPKPGGEPKTKLRKVGNEDSNKEVRDAINAYIRKGEIRENVTTINQEVIIPKDISYIPQKEVQTVYDLSANFNKTNVGTKSGSYPILENPTDALPSVEELAKNPELAAPKFHEVKWEVETYRGALPISQEAISDAQTDLTTLISNQISQRMLNTTNKFIAAKLKDFEKVTPGAKDDLVDNIKEILNVKLDPAYIPQIICTQSLYQTLDTLKDKQGQYIFHRDVTSASGGTLLGVPVTKVPDPLLGDKIGDQVAFIGDRRAVTVFDRNQASVVWAENSVYGRYLMGVLRFDVEVTDQKAGFLLTVSGDIPTPSKP